ncbi:MAG: hypothetical protein JWL81_47 [Verrucomicrobiales bacterium]|nr:hypothetical protein [Verrucomicrobiales bacterium]
MRLLLLLTTLLLAACSGDSAPTEDHRTLESPAGEAVLRHMLTLCPHREEAKQLTLVLGPLQDAATTEFETRFTDTGLTITPSRKLVAGAVNGEIRIFDGVTNQAPIILQLTSLTPEPTNPANSEAVAAWAFKDKAKRLRLRVIPQPATNTFDIQQIEEIPIPPRNQDGMPKPQEKKA